jgi:hypothetical protein
MTKKSKRKRKRQKQQTTPITQSQKSTDTNASVKKEVRLLEVLGIFLTALGLISLIGLRPRSSASATSPQTPNRPLTSRFTITNDGYLKLTHVSALCYVWKSKSVYGGSADQNVFNIKPPSGILEPSESFTVPCQNAPVLSPEAQVDLAIIMSYRPWPFTFLHMQRFFRFVSRKTLDGTFVWDKQPSDPSLEKSFSTMKNNPTNRDLPMFNHN